MDLGMKLAHALTSGLTRKISAMRCCFDFGPRFFGARAESGMALGSYNTENALFIDRAVPQSQVGVLLNIALPRPHSPSKLPWI